MKRLFVLFLVFCIIFIFACSHMHTQEDPIEEKYSDEKTIFDNKPLRILINSKKQNYGFDVIGQNMFTSTDFFDLLHVIGEECEERFGYPVEFISLPANSAKNDYLSAMQSSMEIDLIFPSKVYEHIASDYDAFYFWNDEFIEFYKDLSPYAC
ncbi:MAG TPA: hypothetical protein DDZ89_21345 [Clostridiales bacterium]|nr:hypothetical protein [Clostridiales bacterium]